MILLLLFAADVDLFLCHEKQPPVLLRLTLPSPGKVRVRTLPAALPTSAALTRALKVALAEKDATKVMKKYDADEDGVITPFELVPDLLTVAGKAGRPDFVAVLKAGDDWREELKERYPDLDPASVKPVVVKPKPETRSVHEAGGLTLDVAMTGESKADYTLWVAPQPRGWFEWLDADQDGQLSLVELRGAAKRLGDAPAADYSLTLVPGAGDYGVRLRKPERKARGPAWFAAMDRNGDGYVSRDEWLSTPAAFAKLDADGDGLISPAEAEAKR